MQKTKETRIQVFQKNPVLVGAYILLIVFFIFSAILSPQFRTSYNIFNLLRQAVAYGLVALGQTLAILTAGIDLSVGSLISLSACLTSGLMLGNPNLVIPVILLVLSLGVGIGLANGLMITKLNIPPFITTLAMSSLLQGSVLLYTKKPIGSVTRGFMYFANGQIGPIPFAVIFWAIFIIAFLILLERTSLGLKCYLLEQLLELQQQFLKYSLSLQRRLYPRLTLQ